jgi:K+ transporter
VRAHYDLYKRGTIEELLTMKKNKVYPEIPKAYIFMSPEKISESDSIPTLMQVFIDRYGALPKHIIFLTVHIEKRPIVKTENRYKIVNFGKIGPNQDTIASVVVRFGFMEDPDVESVLQDLANQREIQIDTDKHNWLIEVMHERIYKDEVQGFNRIRSQIFQLLSRFADTADHFFKLGDSEPLAIEVVPVKLK